MDLVLVEHPVVTEVDRESLMVHLMVCEGCSREFDQIGAVLEALRSIWPSGLADLLHDPEIAWGHTSEVTPGDTQEATQRGLVRLFAALDQLKAEEARGVPTESPRGLPMVLKPEERVSNTRDVSGPRMSEKAIPQAPSRGRSGMPAANSWIDGNKRPRRARGWIGTAVSVAACLTLTTLIGWGTWHEVSSPTSRDQEIMSAFYAERVTPQGHQRIPLGEAITSTTSGGGERLEEVVLGGIHHVVMNANTSAIFRANGDRYVIDLDRGEIYIKVVPGHPMSVQTPNARLSITGTVFSVRAQRDNTELSVLEGSVRFASPANDMAVDVRACSASTVFGRFSPTVPRFVDALAATAWARRPFAGTYLEADSHVTYGKLDDQSSWFVETPTEVPLRNDRVMASRVGVTQLRTLAISH